MIKALLKRRTASAIVSMCRSANPDNTWMDAYAVLSVHDQCRVMFSPGARRKVRSSWPSPVASNGSAARCGSVSSGQLRPAGNGPWGAAYASTCMPVPFDLRVAPGWRCRETILFESIMRGSWRV